MSKTSQSPNKLQRQVIAEETHSLTSQILNSTEASTESNLYRRLLPSIAPVRDGRKPKITVQNRDTFTAAKLILDREPGAKIGVLNMASEKNPGGGWLRGALAQEEALCIRSTLAATLHKRYYPLPVFGAIWSPKVAIFRDEIGAWCRVYESKEIFTVGVVSLAALRRPLLTPDKKRFGRPKDIEILKDKMRQVFRVLAQNKATHCVLGAMGCGAFQNPPSEVARVYKEVLEETEWKGIFEEIVFAVLDTRGEGNYAIFRNHIENSA
ncbi:hypothetical protein N7510_005724 [Penicillium lagena]|uniref:uncharacterized protein n=1 Tax=Penicillium lagena TaxID=94218 RepID=UPI00253F99EE|nr:uncharacterized protein N7510_005724 [Penicillium lagena]KAJ5612530.1 hypothetical protein N7510_005724 [Penicillium lagena]